MSTHACRRRPHASGGSSTRGVEGLDARPRLSRSVVTSFRSSSATGTGNPVRSKLRVGTDGPHRSFVSGSILIELSLYLRNARSYESHLSGKWRLLTDLHQCTDCQITTICREIQAWATTSRCRSLGVREDSAESNENRSQPLIPPGLTSKPWWRSVRSLEKWARRPSKPRSAGRVWQGRTSGPFGADFSAPVSLLQIHRTVDF